MIWSTYSKYTRISSSFGYPSRFHKVAAPSQVAIRNFDVTQATYDRHLVYDQQLRALRLGTPCPYKLALSSEKGSGTDPRYLSISLFPCAFWIPSFSAIPVCIPFAFSTIIFIRSSHRVVLNFSLAWWNTSLLTGWHPFWFLLSVRRLLSYYYCPHYTILFKTTRRNPQRAYHNISALPRLLWKWLTNARVVLPSQELHYKAPYWRRLRFKKECAEVANDKIVNFLCLQRARLSLK